MPVAASDQRDAPVSSRLRRFLPGYHNTHDTGIVTDHHIQTQYSLDPLTITQRELEHYASSLSAHGSPASAEEFQDYFNTNSPPVLNLSPNLSPASEAAQRNSPVYDLRDTTRRRAYQGV